MDDRIEKTINQLKKNHFRAYYFTTSAEAKDYILKHIRYGDSVGMGGSMTLSAMNLEKDIEALGAIVLNHNKLGLSSEEKDHIRRQQLICDVFLTSSNAVTEAGQLFNIDGIGNRVSAINYGPQKVIIVMGTNKIVANIEKAYERVRSIAAPLNNKRLRTNNPCVKAGHCLDCQSEDRICNIISIMERKPMASDITIILIDDNLGY